MDEDAFLRKLLENPADDVVRLVYADWLEERDTDEAKRKAEFLRVQLTLADKKQRRGKTHELRVRQVELANSLPPTWLAVVSRLPIENCGPAGNRISLLRAPVQFKYPCPRQWADLTPMDDPTTRYCPSCDHIVYYCHSIPKARDHAVQGHCVAVDATVPRRTGDLEPPPMLLGRMLPPPTTDLLSPGQIHRDDD